MAGRRATCGGYNNDDLKFGRALCVTLLWSYTSQRQRAYRLNDGGSATAAEVTGRRRSRRDADVARFIHLSGLRRRGQVADAGSVPVDAARWSCPQSVSVSVAAAAAAACAFFKFFFYYSLPAKPPPLPMLLPRGNSSLTPRPYLSPPFRLPLCLTDLYNRIQSAVATNAVVMYKRTRLLHSSSPF